MSDPNHGEITVTTGSRLHFGLMRTGPPFGGLGVMIDQPQISITIKPSDHWRCDGQLADRILPIARRLVQYSGTDQLPRCNVQIHQEPASHCGLGSGTQLSLAIAEGMCSFANLDIPPLKLATEISDRGKRSAVGVHGYFAGGMIYETPVAGHMLNPITERIELPSDWRVAFFVPANPVQSISGDDEANCFSQLGREDMQQIDQLRRTITDRILPAAASSDFNAFCDAVADYNQQSGLLFADIQGGPYNGPAVTTLIQILQDLGLRGVGQSSWGPGVFAWFESQASLEQFQERCGDGQYRIKATAGVLNRGRDISR